MGKKLSAEDVSSQPSSAAGGKGGHCWDGAGGRSGLALGVHWDVLRGARGGCWARGHDHSPFVLTALSTALGRDSVGPEEAQLPFRNSKHPSIFGRTWV